MDNFEKKLDKYAELAIKVGINLEDKEGLIIGGNTSTLPLARAIMKKAYEAGAKHVEFQLGDDEMQLIRYNHGKEHVFTEFPKWKVDSLEAMYKDNYHHMFISAPNPELLKEIDGDLIAKSQKSASLAVAPIMKYRMTHMPRMSLSHLRKNDLLMYDLASTLLMTKVKYSLKKTEK